MLYATPMAALARRSGTVLLHFAHGSLVVAGLIVMVLVGARFADQGVSGLTLPDVFGRHEVIARESAAALPVEELESELGAVAAAEPVVVPRLSPEMGRVTDYLARRYKVSRAAIEPLILSALQTGRTVGLDPLLIIAVMGIESKFNPFAESPFGAQGLMQVVPRFHKDKIDPEAGEHPLLEPAENIRVGSMVLKEYIRRNGSLAAGLQQYAGAGSDGATSYANRVIAETERLKLAMKSGARSNPAS
ncbi:MAG: transglycosylase SLT domain-containing protein [Betaproteobacteria bacterium]|nr:transglycosylase SLT domain-containing protein [Betaproteobacteria bacterium]